EARPAPVRGSRAALTHAQAQGRPPVGDRRFRREKWSRSEGGRRFRGEKWSRSDSFGRCRCPIATSSRADSHAATEQRLAHCRLVNSSAPPSAATCLRRQTSVSLI